MAKDWRKQREESDDVTTKVSKIMCSIRMPEGKKLKRPEWHKVVYGGKRSG